MGQIFLGLYSIDNQLCSGGGRGWKKQIGVLTRLVPIYVLCGRCWKKKFVWLETTNFVLRGEGGMNKYGG